MEKRIFLYHLRIVSSNQFYNKTSLPFLKSSNGTSSTVGEIYVQFLFKFSFLFFFQILQKVCSFSFLHKNTSGNCNENEVAWYTQQCGNYENLLTRCLAKNYVKAMFALSTKELISRKNFSARVNFSFFHTVAWIAVLKWT